MGTIKVGTTVLWRVMAVAEIMKLVKEYFREGGVRDDGSCSEYYGDLDTFVKFAEKMCNQGKYDGYEDGRCDGYSIGADASYYF